MYLYTGSIPTPQPWVVPVVVVCVCVLVLSCVVIIIVVGVVIVRRRLSGKYNVHLVLTYDYVKYIITSPV